MADEPLKVTLVPRDYTPMTQRSQAYPPEEIFAGLQPIERQAVIAYVEAGSYKEAIATIEQWRSNEGKSADQVVKLTSRIFTRPHVRAAIGRLQSFWAEHAPTQVSRILGALEAQAFADPAQIYEQDGDSWELKPLSEWPLALRQSVQKIHYTEVTSGYGKLRRVTKRVSVDLSNRQTALELLGRHLHMWSEHKEDTVPFTLVVNTLPDESKAPKQVGPQVIDGVGLQIHVPEP